MPNKILIVDDEPFNLDLLEQELADYDYVIERASDGVEALEKIGVFKPDVILLDYMMPKMNGLEVVKRLRQIQEHKGIPVILLTAKATQEDKIAGLDAGADDYVTKPFDSFELLARVRAMLRIKQLHDTLDEWNRTLADKVKRQVDELERMARLKRYLSPQIAEKILSVDDHLFKTHRREITIVFLDLRVGIAAGYATLGTMGFEGRMDYGTVGNLPNLAARLCAEAKGGQILTDQKTVSRLEDAFEAEPIQELNLKGINRPVAAFNIMAHK